jgi:hypothetical protein
MGQQGSRIKFLQIVLNGWREEYKRLEAQIKGVEKIIEHYEKMILEATPDDNSKQESL